MPRPMKFKLGALVECISEDHWDDPMAPEVGEILRVDGIGVDEDGMYLSFEETEDFYISTAFRLIKHTYAPWVDWRADLKRWGCRVEKL